MGNYYYYYFLTLLYYYYYYYYYLICSINSRIVYSTVNTRDELNRTYKAQRTLTVALNYYTKINKLLHIKLKIKHLIAEWHTKQSNEMGDLGNKQNKTKL